MIRGDRVDGGHGQPLMSCGHSIPLPSPPSSSLLLVQIVLLYAEGFDDVVAAVVFLFLVGVAPVPAEVRGRISTSPDGDVYGCLCQLCLKIMRHCKETLVRPFLLGITFDGLDRSANSLNLHVTLLASDKQENCLL